MSLKGTSISPKKNSARCCASIRRTTTATTIRAWSSWRRSFRQKRFPYLQRVHPQTIASRFNLTRAYLEAGRTAEGLKAAQELSAQNKETCNCISLWAYCSQPRSSIAAAQLELEQANALQPETFEILHNLGQAYLRGDEYAKAELALNRALKLKPDSPETFICWRRSIRTARARGRPRSAGRAHKLAPENTDIIFCWPASA